ncbi:MAG: hypothetical protein KF891_08620 [Rhizobacter sp.]|nr:hypothetical protein [Rhizobacter sp.]
MAAAFAVFSVPSAHIEYLKHHPGHAHFYAEGGLPDEAEASMLPQGWPTEPLHKIVSWGVNWRNADLYHWILNGASDLVHGGGSIFQTWYAPTTHSAIALDPHNESFAFEPAQIAELAALAGSVDIPRVREAFSAWSQSRGDDYVPDDMACSAFVWEFNDLAKGLEQVMADGHGLVWI